MIGQGKAVFQFNERQHLETVMPANYNEKLCNRVYKRRVIDLIAETVVDHIRLEEGQRLVVDYVVGLNRPLSFCAKSPDPSSEN